jgi:hypothetical protein
MNRNVKILIIAVLLSLLMGSVNQGVTTAQGPEPPGSPEIGPTSPQPGSPGEEPPPVQAEPEPEAQSVEPLAALVGSSFTYQGQLKNSGAPVNVACDFTWNIFADASGGVSLAVDTDTNILVSNGLFTAVINVPASVIDGNQRFVEIQVRCPSGGGPYTLLTPRQELHAAPYALGLRLPFSHSINSSVAPVFAITNTGGIGSSPAILGSSVGSDGVKGLSTGAASADNGVYGETNSSSISEAGVKGLSTSTAAGGYFTSATGYGVYGSTNAGADFGGYFTNPTVTTSGGALYANGDAKQSIAGDGFVKAGALVYCSNSGAVISRSFNNANTTPITVINGSAVGQCTVDFGFDITTRYVTAMAYGDNVPRIVTFSTGSSNNRMDFFRYDQNGAGVTGEIMILIY